MMHKYYYYELIFYYRKIQNVECQKVWAVSYSRSTCRYSELLLCLKINIQRANLGI